MPEVRIEIIHGSARVRMQFWVSGMPVWIRKQWNFRDVYLLNCFVILVKKLLAADVDFEITDNKSEDTVLVQKTATIRV